ncbi:MAG: sigma-70 family RNA polymerase sigma factor [Deltaproteobacteria bacterium]|nr:sigma-70 family RNA polymerase sigma factor [Deltaproteobacteria bacterium]
MMMRSHSEETMGIRDHISRVIAITKYKFPDEWEDVAGECLLSIVRARQTYRREASANTYVSRIILRRCADHLRRKYRRQRLLECLRRYGEFKRQMTPEEIYMYRERLDSVFLNLPRLSPKERLVVAMMLGGSNGREISETLNISQSRAGNLRGSAIEKLRRRLS